MRTFRWTLRIVAIVQFVVGAVLLVPGLPEMLFDLAEAPGWVGWMLAMSGARFVGFGIGMMLASGDPAAHRPWVSTMVLVQAIDWLATIAYLLAGSVTLAQVTTAAFLPVAFIVVLLWGLRELDRAEAASADQVSGT